MLSRFHQKKSTSSSFRKSETECPTCRGTLKSLREWQRTTDLSVASRLSLCFVSWKRHWDLLVETTYRPKPIDECNSIGVGGSSRRSKTNVNLGEDLYNAHIRSHALAKLYATPPIFPSCNQNQPCIPCAKASQSSSMMRPPSPSHAC